MAFDPQRTYDVDWAFSRKQQADYATALVIGDMLHRTSFRQAVFADQTINAETDREQFGKGHAFSTERRIVSKDVRFAREFDASSLMMAWAAAFCMGKVVTVGAVEPWTHTITLADPTLGLDAPVTTIYEGLSAGIKRKIPSLAINDFSVSFQSPQKVALSINAIGSGNVVAGAETAPAITPQFIYLAGDTTVVVSDLDGSNPITLSERMVSGQYSVNHNLGADLGYFPGSGQVRGRIWYGQPQIRLSLRAFFNDSNDLEAIFQAGSLKKVVITHALSANHSCVTTFPAVIFPENPKNPEQVYMVHNLSTGADGIFKDQVGQTPNEPVQLVIKNNFDTFLAVAA